MAISAIDNPNIYTKVWTVNLDSISGANGAYYHKTAVPKMTTDYKPILFECDNPSIFKDTVSISTAQGSVALSCNNAIGSTTGVKASFVLQGDADTLSSAEYQALGNRIGDLNDLTTSDKSSVVGAINAVDSKLTSTGLKHIAAGYGLADYVSSTRCKYDVTYSGFTTIPKVVAINNSGEAYICSIKYGNTKTAATIYIDDSQGRFSPAIRPWITWIAVETY